MERLPYESCFSLYLLDIVWGRHRGRIFRHGRIQARSLVAEELIFQRIHVIEQDTHEELLALQGRYYELYTSKKPD